MHHKFGVLDTDPQFHMDSIWSPPGVYLESIWSPRSFPGVYMESRWNYSQIFQEPYWTPYGVYWTPWTIPGVLLDSIGLHFRVHSDSSRTISGLHMEFGKLLVDWSPPEVHGVSPESRQPMRSLTSN